MTLSTQQLLIAVVPGLIGNLNGVPYATRDKANRNLLNWWENAAG